MASSVVSTQVQLVARPVGWPTDADFRTVQVKLGDLAAGQVRVANEFLSVDPYMRGRMNDAKSYAPPYALGATMTGGAVGRVVGSASDGVAVGDVVVHQLGWRDVAQDDAAAFRVVPEIPGVPLSAYLGVLGMTAFTAYVGLLEIAQLAQGETVFVSGAAGAVGSMVGQIARLKGAGRVVGSAGSAAKVALLTDRYGFDAAFNYNDGAVSDLLASAAPDGIDVYFDNVGGAHLEAALESMRPHGRIIYCGAVSTYNDAGPAPGPRNLNYVIGKRLTIKGFIVIAHFDEMGEFIAEAADLLASGKLRMKETVVEGIERAPQAFIDLLNGGNTGKMVVKL